MASFEDLLMQTMPLAGLYTEVTHPYAAHTGDFGPDLGGDAPKPVYDFPSLFDDETVINDAGIYLTRLEPDESWDVPEPSIEPADYENSSDANIWCWHHDASTPWKVSTVTCRVRSADYGTYKVLDSLEWGLELEEAKGALKSCIRITNVAGKRFELPLTKDFVTYKAAIGGGRIDKDQTDLWKLDSNHDQSLVIAFVYSLEPGQPPRVMTANEANDLGDNFMASGGAANPGGAEVHGETSVDVGHPRVIVILSLTSCKQGDDFAPGGIVGMGRFYPHMMVMSSMPLSLIEGTVRLNRPATSPPRNQPPKDTVAPPSGLMKPFVNFFKGPKGCCSIYDDHEIKINSVFFADANDFGVSVFQDPPMPFWSNFFSHYLLTAHDAIQNETVVAVTRYKGKDRDKDQTIVRSKNGMIVRQPVTGPKNYPTLIKMPYQGEFDNIHMAPRMILSNVEKAIHMGETLAAPPDGRESPGPTVFDVPIESLQLDTITMAPFCAHDCFHTHWRWGKDATDAAQCGFDGMVPYKKPGAPHVPANQTLHVWLRAPNLLTYSVIVWPLSGKPIPANAWQVIMHHGSAYALDVTGFIAAYLAKFSVDAFGGQPQFYEDDTLTTPVTSAMSFSLFYWRLRWETVLVDGKPQLRERVSNLNLRAARDL